VRGRRTLRAEELAGDVQGLTSHNDDLLAVEQLLGNGAGEATEQVPLAVDDLNGELARGSFTILWACWSAVVAGAGERQPLYGMLESCIRSVRTMTGSKVDMVLESGCAVVSWS